MKSRKIHYFVQFHDCPSDESFWWYGPKLGWHTLHDSSVKGKGHTNIAICRTKKSAMRCQMRLAMLADFLKHKGVATMTRYLYEKDGKGVRRRYESRSWDIEVIP